MRPISPASKRVAGADEARQRRLRHDRLADPHLAGAEAEPVRPADRLGAQHEHGQRVRQLHVDPRGAVRPDLHPRLVERHRGEVLAHGDVLHARNRRASSPPGFSCSGMTPNAMLRVSRAAMRAGRSTMKAGSGSSGCSLASASTAWSTIQTVASPASGCPAASARCSTRSNSCAGRALAGASKLTRHLVLAPA